MSQKAAAYNRILIDQEHRVLRTMIDTLQEAINQEISREEIELQKVTLLARLDEHQERERRIMMDTNFPLAFTHLESHESFRDQVKLILSSIDSTVIDNANIAKLLIRVHDHHIKYFDDILTFYLIDKYSLEAVDDGLGI